MVINELPRLDAGGRVFVPALKREQFSGEVFMVVVQGKLLFFTQEEGEKFLKEKTVGMKGAKKRRKDRLLWSLVFLQPIDRQGRVKIPLKLREALNGQ